MDELTQLANALMALDDKLAACMKCGFCQAFCPMYMTTRIEGDLTRGKIALVENLAHRIIEDPEAVNEKLSRCLLCGSCQANCPSGVKTTDIFLEARAIVATYLGLSAIKKAAFRMLLPNPRLFGTLLRLSAPFQNLILQDEAKPHNVDILKDQNYDYIVTPCSSCTVAIREFWAQFSDNLPPRYRDAINALAPKAIDINALLVDVLHVSPKTQAKGQTKVTYHESCHLQKSLSVSKQPRDLIRMNPGYNLVEMAEANRCCGSFTLTHYDLSLKMGQRKRDNVIASGAEVVATGCPACMMQLSDMLARNNDPVQVKHTIEIYAESLPL